MRSRALRRAIECPGKAHLSEKISSEHGDADVELGEEEEDARGGGAFGTRRWRLKSSNSGRWL